jgi:hypothetical protein
MLFWIVHSMFKWLLFHKSLVISLYTVDCLMASEFCYNQGVIHLIITSMYSMRYFNYLTIHTTRLLSRVWENKCLLWIFVLFISVQLRGIYRFLWKFVLLTVSYYIFYLNTRWLCIAVTYCNLCFFFLSKFSDNYWICYPKFHISEVRD